MENIATLKGLKCPHCGSEQLSVTGTKGALGASIASSAAFGAIGNLVAGSNAKSNHETGPLQYKCAGCKKKFEALPLMAPAQDVLAVPCTVTFTRESSFVGAAVPQVAYINGIKLGAVKNGKFITFTTSNRYNIMFVTDQYGVAFKGEYRFEAQPGGNVSVRFKRKFLEAPLIPPVAPVAYSMPPVTPESVSPQPTMAPAAYSMPTATPASVSPQPSMNPAAVSTGQTPPACFCTKCGGALTDEDMFCSNCGAKRFSPEKAFSGTENRQ